MARHIQALVFDQRGLDVPRLAAIIQTHYRTPEGRAVKVKVGQGLYEDGIPEGALRIVDRDDPPPMPESWEDTATVDRNL
jgi:hypothetical protein